MFSASGAERWLNCPGSVALEEASPPSADSPWSLEGTKAHELLESELNGATIFGTGEMVGHVYRTAQKIKAIHKSAGGTLFVERRVYALFLDPEMFGTCDAIIAGDDGWLHIIDFKYGAGHVVSPEKNPQLIQYALSVAESYNWDFDKVKMWILQPRAGENWYKSWTITMDELQNIWWPVWAAGVGRVRKAPLKKINPGHWCHWCRAKLTCPAKQEKRTTEIVNRFQSNPI